MSDEWGPWIAWGGGSNPAPGRMVSVEFRIPPCASDNCFGNPECDMSDAWVWWHDGDGDDIVRYRIRKPRGMKIIEELLENLPAPSPRQVSQDA